MERKTDGSSPDLVGLHDSVDQPVQDPKSPTQPASDSLPSTSDQVVIDIDDSYHKAIISGPDRPILSRQNVHAFDNDADTAIDIDTDNLVNRSPDVPYSYTNQCDVSLSPGEKNQLQKDYARLLDDISGKPAPVEVSPGNLEPGSFKEGFFTPQETPRHFVDEHDMSDHHRTGEFPHLRHLMSPGSSNGHHKSHHHSHGGSHKKKGHHRKHRKSEEKDVIDKEPGTQPSEESLDSAAGSSPVPIPGAKVTDGKSSDLSTPGTSGSPSSAEPTPSTIPKINLQSDEEQTPSVGFFIDPDEMPSPLPGKKAFAPSTRKAVSGDRRVSFSFDIDNNIGSGGSLDKPRKTSMPIQEEKDKVIFSLGGDGSATEMTDNLRYSKTMPGEIDPSGSHKRKRHHLKVPSKTDLEARRTRGSEVELSTRERSLTQFPLTNEKYSQLDLEEMASHRFGDPIGLQRRKVSHSAATSVIQVAQVVPPEPPKPQLDHHPHELFVELDELFTGEDNHYEWKEKARWIKYEEDVEEGANKWGKPHVSSLSFHSLLDLRKCIETGVILLDLQQDSLPAIASCITEELVKSKQLAPENRGKVLRVLLLKHKHMDERGFIRRNSTFFQLSSARDQSYGTRATDKNSTASERASMFSKKTPLPRPASLPSHNALSTGSNGNTNSIAAESVDGIYKKSQDDSLTPEVFVKTPTFSPMSPVTETDEVNEEQTTPTLPRNKSMPDASILKRIPEGAETTSVLVGSVDYLDKPIMAFVRLAEGCELENLTEVPLPVRFLFLLMGPPKSRFDYHEIGRSISTLMSNTSTSFHDVAYMAEDRTDLLKALNVFLDESIVLPPGEIDKKVLLPIIDMAKERERQKKKRKKEKDQKELLVKDLEPPKPPFDPLKRTGRPFGGVVNDVKKRYPYYWSDIKDGLNTQCLATFFFVYFACLSPAITFGGLLSEKTEQWLGVTEMLVGTFVCGTLFSLTSGQPLLIVGGTGPVLVFEVGLYQFCGSTGLDFMSFRCWVGVWVCVVVLVIVGSELIFMVRYFTRFTEEIFASLISLIFIIEVFIKINNQFQTHPLQEYYSPVPGCVPESGGVTGLFHTTMDYITGSIPITEAVTTQTPLLDENSTATYNTSGATENNDHLCYVNKPNTALLSVILTFGTFFIAYFLKQFRNSKFLGRNARRALGDFGIPIAIVTMLIVDIIIGDKTYTEKLNVPDGMVPTDSSKRGWIINPLGMTKSLPVWAMVAGAIPALLLFILLFMETIITSVIVNKPERKMQKGTGYHLDMMLIGLFAALSGFIGTPFLTVATVRSVTHTSALVVFSKSHAPGEKPKLIEVKEQRLTSFLVHIMLGASTMLGPVLRHIPLAVLFGVFLYMGVASMAGIQLFDRVGLMFKPGKHHPDEPYVRKVRLLKMHLFTVIQLLCLGVLWAVKSTAAALAFPFFLILMVPLRLHVLKFIFSKEELKHLDGQPEEEEIIEHDSDEEPDFYEQAHMPF